MRRTLVPGDKVGLLEVVSVDASGMATTKCECGAIVVRPLEYLMSAKERATVSACKACGRKRRKARYVPFKHRPVESVPDSKP